MALGERQQQGTGRGWPIRNVLSQTSQKNLNRLHSRFTTRSGGFSGRRKMTRPKDRPVRSLPTQDLIFFFRLRFPVFVLRRTVGGLRRVTFRPVGAREWHPSGAVVWLGRCRQWWYVELGGRSSLDVLGKEAELGKPSHLTDHQPVPRSQPPLSRYQRGPQHSLAGLYSTTTTSSSLVYCKRRPCGPFSCIVTSFAVPLSPASSGVARPGCSCVVERRLLPLPLPASHPS